MKLTLTQEDLANLILQRTGTFIAWGGANALKHWLKTGEKPQLAAFLADSGRTAEFVKLTFAEITAEFEELRPHIAALAPASAVSIGPGLGFFEILMYNTSRPNLLLIDIEQSAEHQHGYAQSGSGYSSLASCRNFLIGNSAEPAHITCCNPRKEPLPEAGFDIVVSLLSMGFHYPCDEYVAFITKGLRQGGLMIIDKRTGAPDAGWAALLPLFDVVKSTPASKSERLVLARR